jgi:hypothetical protein
MTPILLTEVEGMLPNSFSEASITQIPTHICTCAHTHTHTHTHSRKIETIQGKITDLYPPQNVSKYNPIMYKVTCNSQMGIIPGSKSGSKF